MEIHRASVIGDACILAFEDPRLQEFHKMNDCSWEFICDMSAYFYTPNQYDEPKSLANRVIEYCLDWVEKVKTELQEAL